MLKNRNGEPDGDAPLRDDVLYGEFFRHISSGIAVYTAVSDGHDFVFVDVNPAAERIDGISRADVVGRRVTEVFPGVAEFGLVDVLRRVWRTGAAERHPVTLYCDDRISGWRENEIFRLPGGEVVAIYEDRTREIEAENRFRATFEQAAVGMAHVGLDGRFLRINAKLCDITGYSREELQQLTFQEITHPDDLDADLNLANQLWAGTIPFYQIEKRYLRADGSYVWINLTASAGRDPNGQLNYGIAVIEDISAKKEAEALRADEELQRMALSAANAGAWTYDFAIDKQAWSAETHEIFGVAPSAPPPNYEAWLSSCVDPRDRHLFDAALSDAISGYRNDFSIEFRFLHPNKGPRWLLSLGKIVCDAESKPIRAYGLNLDVSEQRELQQALRESEARLRMAMAAGEIGVWDWDIASGRVRWSENLSCFMRMEPQVYEGRIENFRDFLHPDDRDRVEAAIQDALAGKSDYQIEFRMQNPEGRVRWTETRAIVLRDRDGRPTRMIGVDMEITRRKAEEAHRDLLAAELNHRVKNILALVEATMMLTWHSAPSPEAFRDAFSARLHAIARGNDLLVQSEWRPVHLANVVESALAAFGSAHRIALPDVPVHLAPKAALALNLILHELGTNAAKYGALSVPEGVVSVACSLREGEPDTLVCKWKETGGPQVHPPSRKGFGSTLIEETARSDLGGTASLSYPPDGAECVIRFPFR
ncbi:PAS domain-containing protein [Dichotomicrobium thermohalophilum]|uniref:Blue-light-activated histidine kinase n=1 Tax=Dichotomicrobium thermohalophilum TaxID=933063 RepID=A0A397PKL0_9HYPH|nr:PAS domain-containing protein [Dichotomicrobium thermohalophilum]RIA47687.1 PAS domain S-box-containing protein [Dichotomicrobium thermohalophilum]